MLITCIIELLYESGYFVSLEEKKSLTNCCMSFYQMLKKKKIHSFTVVLLMGHETSNSINDDYFHFHMFFAKYM